MALLETRARARWCLVLWMLVHTSACREPRSLDGNFLLEPPAQIIQALATITDLEASAALIPSDRPPRSPVPLERAPSGDSFSGFLPADPGDYTLEIVFTGVDARDSQRYFLGRLTSDVLTVVAGDTVAPTFTRPLDTVGRDSDHGDDDADGFGALDEILWSTSLTSNDSDQDGVLDGTDCAPNDMLNTFAILTGGSHEDCDADGVKRPDVPYGVAGTDCNDRDATVYPGAEDRCDDEIDQDCNPETCPFVDTTGPAIEVLGPADGATVGCHRYIEARVIDPSGVASVTLDFVDSATPPGVIESIPMQALPNDVYRIATFDRATSFWLANGVQRFVVHASDRDGNESTLNGSVTFQLDLPQVTITPQTVGPQSMAFNVTVQATAPSGLASIRLMIAPIATGGEVARSAESEIGSGTSSPLMVSVDPTQLADGDYALYPLVADAVGNELKPDDTFTPEDTGNGELSSDPDYLCVFDPGPGRVPVRRLAVGAAQIPPAKMRDHLAEARMLAAMRDAMAELVEIRGWGIEPDGTIQLGQTTGGTKLWRYQFINFAVDRNIEVTWHSAEANITNPEIVVEENYAFSYAYQPIMNPDGLVDSDVAVARYAGIQACPALTGHTDDDIRYESDLPFTSQDVVRITAANSGPTYKGTAVAPMMDIWLCE